MSLDIQQNQINRLINTNGSQTTSQDQQMIQQNVIVNNRQQSIELPSLKNVWYIMLVLIVLFVLFILWVVSILTSISYINIQSPTKQIQDKQLNTTTIVIQQKIDYIKELVAKYNINNQPIDLFFAQYLLKNQQNKFYGSQYPQQKHQHQIKYYKRIYGDYNKQVTKQISMCVVATGRNNMALNRQQRFLDSLQRLNYDKFTFVYVDDNSEDKTVQFTESYIKNNIKLKNKGNVIRRDKRYYALANKIIAIQNYCQINDIIIDVDADDSFIGRQVLNIVNYLYTKNNQIWFLYTNHLLLEKQKYELGKNRQLNQTEIKQYRISSNWVTSHLKTFKRQLFMKIDKNQWKRSDGQYFHWASDRYLIYSILELAGFMHTKFQNIILYLYDYSAASDVRNFQVIKPDKIKSQLLVPYQPLNSLSEESKKVQNYKPPALLSEYYRRAQQKYQFLISKNKINQ